MLLGQLLVQQQQGFGLLAVGQFARGQQTVVGHLAAEQGCGARLTHQALHLRVFFSRQGFFQQRFAAGVRLFEQRQGRQPAHLHFRTEQLQGRQGGVQFASQAVVQHHIFGVCGHGNRLSGHRIQALPIAHHQHLVFGHLDHIIGQRLQKCGGLLIALGHGLRQSLHTRIAFAH